MKETPIIMSGNHPRLIMDGLKTQTRRVVSPQTSIVGVGRVDWSNFDWEQKTVRHFMDIHDLPYHKMAMSDRLNVDDKRHGDDVTIPTMAF